MRTIPKIDGELIEKIINHSQKLNQIPAVFHVQVFCVLCMTDKENEIHCEVTQALKSKGLQYLQCQYLNIIKYLVYTDFFFAHHCYV